MLISAQEHYYNDQEQYPADQYYDHGHGVDQGHQAQYYEDADIGGGYHGGQGEYQGEGAYDYNQDGYEDYPVDAYPAENYDPRHGPSGGQPPAQYYGEGAQPRSKYQLEP